MLEKLIETENLWDRLKRTQKPILLYGMGDGALKIMAELKKREISLSGIFASDEFVRGHSFEGYPVRRFSEVLEQYEDFVILLAFAAFQDPLLSKIYRMSEDYELYAPDVPVCAEKEGEVFTLEYIAAHEAKLDAVYDMLADEQSKQVFLNVLNFKVSGKVSYLREITTPVSEAYENILRLGSDEDYVDLGAYNGDTVEEFLGYTGGAFRSITAFEPDRKNYAKLLKRMETLGLSGQVNAVNVGSYSEPGELLFAGKAGRNSALSKKEGVPTPVESVDHLMDGRRVSFLKLDVEGAEQASLLGAQRSIRAFAPKLLISAYHKNSDLFQLPLLVREFYPDYRVYLRHHPYVPAWETNFYLIKG